MNLVEYQQQITTANTAHKLFAIRQNAEVDGQLTGAQRRAVSEAVNARFGKLNQLAVGPQKPRW